MSGCSAPVVRAGRLGGARVGSASGHARRGRAGASALERAAACGVAQRRADARERALPPFIAARAQTARRSPRGARRNG
eukprot:6961106-Prymnesium_polylepis.1